MAKTLTVVRGFGLNLTPDEIEAAGVGAETVNGIVYFTPGMAIPPKLAGHWYVQKHVADGAVMESGEDADALVQAQDGKPQPMIDPGAPADPAKPAETVVEETAPARPARNTRT